MHFMPSYKELNRIKIYVQNFDKIKKKNCIYFDKHLVSEQSDEWY